MKKIILLLVILFAVTTILIQCKSDKGPEMGIVKLQNPATEYCLKHGGEVIIVSSTSGEYGVCLFKDGSVCEEWDFFRNKCKVGECKKNCKFEGSPKEGLYDCNGKLISIEKCSVKKNDSVK